MGRTQAGNNNVYCQDNELSWFDWNRVSSQGEMLRFTREAIAFRQRHPSLIANQFYTGKAVPGRDISDIAWHGARLNQPPWKGAATEVLAFTVAGIGRDEADIHAILNMSGQAVDAELPAIPGRFWHLAVNTSAPSPDDVVELTCQRRVPASAYRVAPHTVVVLEARVPRP
jgi:isoamylase